MKKHSALLRRRLGNLQRVRAKTDESERQILKAATDRESTVRAEMEKLRPRVHLDNDAASRYQDLVVELGHLDRVIANAQRHLAP